MIKLAAGLVSGILGGVIRIIGGILVLDEELIIKGLLDIFMGIGGGLVYLAGMILSFMQKLIPVQNAERKLTKEEKDMLERIFMNSISLHNVRIVEGAAGAYGSGRSATTVGNTIYMREIVPGTLSFRSTLVHECVHVWQYQNLGSRYTFEALLAQGSWPKEGDSNPGYNWEFVELGRGNTDWNKFNKEAQAEFIQDVWRVGTLTFGGNTRDGSGAFFDLQEVEGLFSDATAEFVYTGVDDSEHPLAASSTIPMDYTDIATKAVRSLRGRTNLRLSKTIWSGN